MPFDTPWLRRHGANDPAFPARSAAMVLSLLLSACALCPAEPPPASPPVASAPAREPDPPPEPEPVDTRPAAQAAVAPTPPLQALLAVAERQRNLGPAELASELARMGEPGTSPQRQLQLALLLVQTDQQQDTARALGLLQRVAASEAPEAAEFRPLARLLVARLQDLRRIEEQMERQTQQLREANRRIEVLNERLEAMRAIERSLGPRPPAPANGRTAP